MTESQINKRKKAEAWIRKNFIHESCKKIVFTYEKWFDTDGQINTKNDIIYVESREHANSIGEFNKKTKFPFKVMVWCAITYNGASDVVILPLKNHSLQIFILKKLF